MLPGSTADEDVPIQSPVDRSYGVAALETAVLNEPEMQMRMARAVLSATHADAKATARAAKAQASLRAAEEHRKWADAETAARSAVEIDPRRAVYLEEERARHASNEQKAQRQKDDAAAWEATEFARLQAAAGAQKRLKEGQVAAAKALTRAAEIAAAQEKGRRDTELALAAIKAKAKRHADQQESLLAEAEARRELKQLHEERPKPNVLQCKLN